MAEAMKPNHLEQKKQEIQEVLESKVDSANIDGKKMALDKIALIAATSEKLDIVGKDKVRRAIESAKNHLDMFVISQQDSQEALRKSGVLEINKIFLPEDLDEKLQERFATPEYVHTLLEGLHNRLNRIQLSPNNKEISSNLAPILKSLNEADNLEKNHNPPLIILPFINKIINQLDRLPTEKYLLEGEKELDAKTTQITETLSKIDTCLTSSIEGNKLAPGNAMAELAKVSQLAALVLPLRPKEAGYQSIQINHIKLDPSEIGLEVKYNIYLSPEGKVITEITPPDKDSPKFIFEPGNRDKNDQSFIAFIEKVRGPYMENYKNTLNKEIPQKIAELQKKYDQVMRGSMRLEATDQEILGERLQEVEQYLQRTKAKLENSLGEGPHHQHADFIADVELMNKLLNAGNQKDKTSKPLSAALYHGEQLEKFEPLYQNIRNILTQQTLHPKSAEKFKQELETALQNFLENARPYLKTAKTIAYFSEPEKPKSGTTELAAQLLLNSKGEISVSFAASIFSYSEEKGFSTPGRLDEPAKDFESQYQRFAELNNIKTPPSEALPQNPKSRIAGKAN